MTSENPCFLDPATDKCAIDLAWQTDPGAGKVTVRIQNHNVSTPIVTCQDQGASATATFQHIRATPKTLELFLTDATHCADQAYLDTIEPDVAVAVMGVSEPLIALQQQCILRGSEVHCETPLQWLAEPDLDYPAVQIRTTPAAFPNPPGTVWRCSKPATDTVFQDDYPFANFNGQRLTAYRAGCCPGEDNGTGCSDDLAPEPLGSVVVRGIPELKGVWLMPNLVTDSDLSTSQDPDLLFTAEGVRPNNRWMTRVVSTDPTEQQRRDIQLTAELRTIAEDGFNMVMFPLQNGVVPWPDPDDPARDSVPEILPEIEAVMDNVVRIIELAAAEQLLVGFNLQHHCLISNAYASQQSCPHIGGTNGLPICDGNNIATAKQWHEEIFDYLETQLTDTELRYLVELAPVAHYRSIGGGDPSNPYTLDDPCHEEVEKYLRIVFPHLQSLTDIPLVAAVKPKRFRTPTAAQYAPIRGLLGTLPNFVIDFLDVTSYYEDRQFNGGSPPVTLAPQYVLDPLGVDFSTKLILSDMNVRNMLSASERATLSPADQRQETLDRAPCNIKFHLDLVPETSLDLAGTWFLGHRSSYSDMFGISGAPTGVGVRERNCVATLGSEAECTFNDPNDDQLLDAFLTPSCP